VIANLALALTLSASGAQTARTIRGSIPDALSAPARVLWIDASEAGPEFGCDLTPPATWTCAKVPPDAAGVVVVAGEATLAYIPVGVADDNAPSVLAWGRVLRLTPGGVAPDDVHDIQVSGWQPERSAVRTNVRRFPLTKDISVQILRLSPTSFWIAGNPTDPDAFHLIEGPAVASMRLPISVLADGPPDLPVFLSLIAPTTLSGHVQSKSDQDTSGATVELWQPFDADDAAPPASDADTSYVLRATVITDAAGAFEFPRLEPGRYRVSARHDTLGRGTAQVTSLAEPVVIYLKAPARATGRVWRGGAPVVGARVRFVPDPDAFRTGRDPTDQFAADVTTDADGRFVLSLPPKRAGTLQIIASDGAIARATIPSGEDGDVQVGDMTLADKRRVMVRLLDPARCTLYATGPLGPLGMTMLTATGVVGTYWLDLPEPGTWILSAECGGTGFSLEPPSITVTSDGPDPVVAARLVRPDGRRD